MSSVTLYEKLPELIRDFRLRFPTVDVQLLEMTTLEQFRQVETRSGLLQTMPTDRMRNGDFGEALTGRQLAVDPLGRPIMENAIYDPRTTRVVNGQVVRDPFPNNRIPTEMLDPVALKIQSLIPAPDNNERLNNYGPNIENHRYQSIPKIKIDHNIGSATTLPESFQNGSLSAPVKCQSVGLPFFSL